MASPSPPIIDKNFILKRVEDRLYLPCTTEISCTARPGLSRATYLMCRTVRFDEGSGRLFLNSPTTLETWSEKLYQVSVGVNSKLILDSNVKAFEILDSGHSLDSLTPPYEWKNLEDAQEWQSVIKGSDYSYLPATPRPPSPHRTSRNETCSIPIQDIQFQDGKVSFTRFFYPILGDVLFEVITPTCIKEFDAIKDYFAKALRTKVIEFQIKLEASGRDIQLKEASYVKGDLFYSNLVEKVQDMVISEAFFSDEGDIYVLEDKLTEATEKLGLKEPANLEWLLDQLGRHKKSKHYDHLRYLAARQEAAAFRLRITAKPVSFIFVIKDKQHPYVVWETYETEEATYIWKLTDLDKKEQAAEVNGLLDKIVWLRAGNKIQYIRSKPPNFWRIEHDYREGDGGFEKWKAYLTGLTSGDSG
jgi:hypothetical protein